LPGNLLPPRLDSSLASAHVLLTSQGDGNRARLIFTFHLTKSGTVMITNHQTNHQTNQPTNHPTNHPTYSRTYLFTLMTMFAKASGACRNHRPANELIVPGRTGAQRTGEKARRSWNDLRQNENGSGSIFPVVPETKKTVVGTNTLSKMAESSLGGL
jgi:hypothetical protein